MIHAFMLVVVMGVGEFMTDTTQLNDIQKY